MTRKAPAPRPAVEALYATLGRPVPKLAIVLGSGSGQLVDALDGAVTMSFSDVPGFPAAGVEGHLGRFVRGRLSGTDVLVQAGRYHAYEGYPPAVVGSPVRLLAEAGVDALVMTNAVGGIRPDLRPGDVVLLEDHINLTYGSPLIGPVVGSEQRFPDMSAPFDAELSMLLREAAAEVGIRLVEGTYGGVLGPSYETAAEVRMMARFGADVVGMSTVPEVIVARALGLRCSGLSLVTNRATGLADGTISHDDVLALGRDAGQRLITLIGAFAVRLEAAQSAGTK